MVGGGQWVAVAGGERVGGGWRAMGVGDGWGLMGVGRWAVVGGGGRWGHVTVTCQ